jgi:molybdopterin molybdotransferase
MKAFPPSNTLYHCRARIISQSPRERNPHLSLEFVQNTILVIHDTSLIFPLPLNILKGNGDKSGMLPFDQALVRILNEISAAESELCDLHSAHRRVLAQDVESPRDVPQFDNSSMDGYALRSENTISATPDKRVEFTVVGEVGAGDVYSGRVNDGTAVRIFTGGGLPAGADAVIEQEGVEAVNGKIYVRGPVPRGKNVRSRGEDIAKGSIILQKGVVVSAARLGILASIGLAQVRVFSVPRVAVLTTGNELAGVDEPLEPGKIRDSNSYTLSSLVRESGCEPASVGRATDSSADLQKKIRIGLESQALITSGGVSVGERDLVLRALEEIGVEIRFWKVNIKPGMPFAFGVYRREGTTRTVPVFGLPGNPVSTMVTFLQLVRPALFKMCGRIDGDSRLKLLARIEHDYEKRDGKRHFARGVLRNENNELLVRISGSQSSGVLTSLSVANCLIVIPEEASVIKAGSSVQVELLRETN